MQGRVPILSAEDVGRAVRRIAHEILERHHGTESLMLVGIHTRGAPLAQGIADAIEESEGVRIPVGELDIGLYRDDIGCRPTAKPATTLIPVDVSGQTVVLVDDVLFTGRTIRAALDALSDLGRPERVELAVMVDRGHRQLPIRPDYVGKNLPTSTDERVTVRVSTVDGETGIWIERQSDG